MKFLVITCRIIYHGYYLLNLGLRFIIMDIIGDCLFIVNLMIMSSDNS
jgi:hypothetical protein